MVVMMWVMEVKKRPILVVIFLLLTTTFWVPEGEGDVALIPGAVIDSNVITINITVDGDDSLVTVENWFNVSSNYNYILRELIGVEGGEMETFSMTSPESTYYSSQSTTEMGWSYSSINDTVETIDFQYVYSQSFSHIGGLNFTRIFHSSGFPQMWTEYFMDVMGYRIELRSNAILYATVGQEVHNGTYLEFDYDNDDRYWHSNWYHSTWGYPYHFVDIMWGSGNYGRITENINCEIRPSDYSDIETLIVSEDVVVDIVPSDDHFSYTLTGSFILNLTTYHMNSPGLLWFPENGTSIRAIISLTRSVYDHQTDMSHNETEFQLLKSYNGNRFGQRGFYIEVPDPYYYDYGFHHSSVVADPVLNITIEGRLDNPWFDFVIVTVPIEESSLTINMPYSFDLEGISSPFEDEDIVENIPQRTVTFSGMCLARETVHLEWSILPDGDGDGVPDDVDYYPEDPLEWQDWDSDGIPDNFDTDDDNDGWNDSVEVQLGTDMYDPADMPGDLDEDGIPDKLDEDTDGDGALDVEEMFPYDPSEMWDTDLDGIGDNADMFLYDPAASLDSDGDGYPDEWNPGMDADDSTDNLTLDHFPEDPDRHEPDENGENGSQPQSDDDEDSGAETSGSLKVIIMFVVGLFLVTIVMIYAKPRFSKKHKGSHDKGDNPASKKNRKRK